MPETSEDYYRPDIDKIDRLKADISQYQGEIPFVRLPINDERILDRLLKMAPYYILLYGDEVIEFVRDKLGAPFPLNWVYKGILFGFKQLQKRFYIK